MELLQGFNPNQGHKSSKFYSVIINKGDTLTVIANKLHDSGLIKNKEFFKYFAKLYNFEKSIKSGSYNISNSLSIKEILNKLNLGKVVQNRITIPEGMTNVMFFKIVLSNKLLSGDLKFSDLQKEGYLAPDIYFYEEGEERMALLNRIQKVQLKRINKIWNNTEKNDTLNSSHELVILASIIEKKSGNYDELSRSLKKSDLRINSIYNTYIINGLPPNPICNPSEVALNAASNPANSKFYYYVSNGKGGHYFSINLEEHNKNVKLYESQFNKSN